MLFDKIAPFLDGHLVLLMLDFMDERKIIPSIHYLVAKHKLLSDTLMVDQSNAVYREHHGTDEPGYSRKREQVLADIRNVEDRVEPVLAIIQDPAVIAQLRNDKAANMRLLRTDHGFTDAMVATLHQLGKTQFSVGNYTGACATLHHVRVLSTDRVLVTSALWGGLCSSILSKAWPLAIEGINHLRDATEQTQDSSLQLAQRASLMHCSLFVFAHAQRGADFLADLLASPPFLATSLAVCPWILRYLAVAAVLSKRKRSILKDIVPVLALEAPLYSDPFTQFLVALYLNFDFDDAHEKLLACPPLMENDLFLCSLIPDFLDAARHAIFELYCRIHSTVDMKRLSSTLAMDFAGGEKWIVNLVRDAHVNAKIDAVEGSVCMAVAPGSAYHNVMEATKVLSFRTTMLIGNIERRESELASRKNRL